MVAIPGFAPATPNGDLTAVANVAAPTTALDLASIAYTELGDPVAPATYTRVPFGSMATPCVEAPMDTALSPLVAVSRTETSVTPELVINAFALGPALIAEPASKSAITSPRNTWGIGIHS